MAENAMKSRRNAAINMSQAERDAIRAQQAEDAAPAQMGILRGAGNAMADLYQRIKRWESDPTLPSSRGDEDIGQDAFALGPGLMLPAGVARVAAGRASGELGIAASELFKRNDARKMVRELKASGSTDREIAEALNDRFAPILDEGSDVTAKLVRDRRRPSAAEKRGDFEVGAMGGSGQQGGRVTAQDVLKMTEEMGLAARVKGSSGGTEYVKIHDPVADPHKQAILEVRIPSEFDPHAGRPRQFMIDTNAMSRYPSPNQRDLAGDTFDANPAAVRSRIEYSFGKQPEPTPAGPPESPPADPRQLKLLSRGIPAPPPGFVLDEPQSQNAMVRP